jgi:hypothetical protein
VAFKQPCRESVMKRVQATEKLCRIIHTVETAPMPIAVKELYVFGSYARGAMNCGDLDIVLVTVEPTEEDRARCPSRGFMNLPDFDRKFRKRLRTSRSERIDILRTWGPSWDKVGKIERKDCVLIWNGDAAWKERIAAIEPDPTAGRAPRREYIFTGQGFARDFEERWRWAEEAIKAGAIRLRRLDTARLESRPWPKIERLREAGLARGEWPDLWKIAASYIADRGKEPCLEGLLACRWILNATDRSAFLYLGKPQVCYIVGWLRNEDVEWAGALPFPRKRKPGQLWVFSRGKTFARYVKDRPPHF